MAILITAPGTLRTEALTEANESKTIVSKWIDAITTEVANGNVKSEGGLTGPTVSARLYSMIGTAAYEAWQATDVQSKSSIGLGSVNESFSGEKLDTLISATILKVAELDSSGITEEGLKNLRDLAITEEAINLRAFNNFPDFRANERIDKVSSSIAAAIGELYGADGYDSPQAYTPINSGPDNVINIEKWTPEYNSSGNANYGLQAYLTPQWGELTPFAISKDALSDITEKAKTPESFLLRESDSYNLAQGTITDGLTGQTLDIDKSLIGTYINPKFIQQTEAVIGWGQQLTNDNQGSINKATAEFWEDGEGTPFPPGTWLVIGQAVSLNNRYGVGEDAKLFQGLGAALHASAISAWDLKLQENYARPVRTIRELSRLGLLTDEDGDVENGSQFRAFNRETGSIDLISGVDFQTYQLPEGGYSPPFPEYTSGHSTFSSSAAEFLELFTGTMEFPSSIKMELTFPYPNDRGEVVLNYDTFEDAAAAAGRSRLFGGIHFEDGNTFGQIVGEQIGSTIYENLSSIWDLNLWVQHS